jgi:uracil-DNA glycosylase family 4
VEFRKAQRSAHPEWHNAPVSPFGNNEAELLIVGLAPGLRGANRTGRPFTGDYAGDLLYKTLQKFGFAEGIYGARRDDGLALRRARITNAVRCVPPQNKPEAVEIANCRRFLGAEIAGMTRLRAILALGAIAHQAVLAALGLSRSSYSFGHGRMHALPCRLILADSYHCSRLNTNTGKLSATMFEAVFEGLVHHLDVSEGTPPRPLPFAARDADEGPSSPGESVEAIR